MGEKGTSADGFNSFHISCGCEENISQKVEDEEYKECGN